ncbi:MAG: hypothetical protein PHI70_06010 [Proteiniphilum sp.]|nr:hypothetical protein [Proteiniphilum sp.]MDD4416319.1 hypothetical protein [Proteiniphilum sp.]
MNTSIAIRDKIHQFVDKADERILRILEAIVDTEERGDPVVPEFFYQELDKDREKHLKGEIPSYNWKEVKSRLIKNHGL